MAAIHGPLSANSSARRTSETTINLTPFDQRHYLQLIKSRGDTLRKLVTELKPVLGLSTAVDAGCGVGFFAETLRQCGLNVCAFDGRNENVVEAQNRYPQIPFRRGDVQDREIVELGKFDLVLCFGLLYHLENLLQAIRNLRALTNKCLLLESMCLPEGKALMRLRDEPAQGDQSLTDVACYPSENTLVKLLYRAGFAAVYRVAPLPEHDDFRETPQHHRRRTVLYAVTAPVAPQRFEFLAEPHDVEDPWTKSNAPPASLPQRIVRFMKSPARRKYVSLALRARKVIPKLPIPLRLPFGGWWLAENSALDQELMHNGFEIHEMRFVERFLRPGMTVLDIGAHHGIYTLLMSKRVGRQGKVIAFEPSPREFCRLEKHLVANLCWNVYLERWATGKEPGEQDLYLVDGYEDWCNSLRPPAVQEPTSKVRVHVKRLDDVLARLGISKVDFIKLDVEGAELETLQGARNLLRSDSRPAILAEVQDIRTRPWGYEAREIIQFLVEMDYRWFALGPDSSLWPVSGDAASYDANLVALPAERATEFQAFAKSGDQI